MYSTKNSVLGEAIGRYCPVRTTPRLPLAPCGTRCEAFIQDSDIAVEGQSVRISPQAGKVPTLSLSRMERTLMKQLRHRPWLVTFCRTMSTTFLMLLGAYLLLCFQVVCIYLWR
ncbi:hypothetical protein E2C01_026785 [Portunus trituberculatus]|uniref:Uncharacterized protein n=1 Tax=Portunus trituberculatus TaxID=210409 RepID=A0A5B7EJ42_PORTR|nr:hypothetical protein [Portunus trituberculatus]